MEELTEKLNHTTLDPPYQQQEDDIFFSLPGLEAAFQSLLEVVQYPIEHRDKFVHLGIEPPKGVLLYGPPGVGKTHLIRELCKATGAQLTLIQGPEILGPYLGDSERQLREKFTQAQKLCESDPQKASILFIDEIDSIAASRQDGGSSSSGGEGQQGARIVAQLLTLMDGLESRGRLVVVGATNRPNALDAALRRPGRFDREISVDVPDVQARERILAYYTRLMPLHRSVDLRVLAESTNGYVGADISSLCVEAATHAMSKNAQGGIEMADFVWALGHVVASTRRGLTVDVVETRWEDIGGLAQIKETLRRAVQWPLERAHTMQRLGIRPSRGVLLHGPPGCSKTTLARVIATQTRASFFSVNGAALYSAFVGDSEKTLRAVFRQARASAPAVVFLDEIESMVGKRLKESVGDSVQERILSTILNEMDGVDGAMDGVLVVGATNRIDMVDDALLRPGRFDRIVYVPPPDLPARREILGIQVKKMALCSDVDLDLLAQRTERFSGADLANLAREAAMLALRQDICAEEVSMADFDKALLVVQASLKEDVMQFYEAVQREYG
ncbi:P-loop containing nucleoside triphosphate hydrolase protein [Kickxella alabastrina]|uniref:P-loop containing nucleoside triphosphate hydrolase protein n=1 Tax=Kickxella alabastrina TaxID=61397 RepID=UPI00221FEA80|nr:P-loop containing nucleoside triphosphate hydrolase protein [Kickxella alabastrina]KAI7826824.1 P-loop containing nucleoside triphosphate hydrolase protein [Kickxella alabastrina]